MPKGAQTTTAASFHKDLADLRAGRLDVLEERQRVADAPPTVAAIADRVAATLEHQRRQAEHDLAQVRAWFRDPEFAIEVGSDDDPTGLQRAFKRSPIGALSLLLGDDFAARVANILAPDAEDEDALDEATRRERLAALDARLDDLERAEERLLRLGEEQGFAVSRRPDARPEIFLAINL